MTSKTRHKKEIYKEKKHKVQPTKTPKTPNNKAEKLYWIRIFLGPDLTVDDIRRDTFLLKIISKYEFEVIKSEKWNITLEKSKLDNYKTNQIISKLRWMDFFDNKVKLTKLESFKKPTSDFMGDNGYQIQFLYRKKKQELLLKN
jgi:hypothetical protein